MTKPDLDLESCPHLEAWFDRAICPEPCGGIHTYCTECDKRLEPCPWADSGYPPVCTKCGHATLHRSAGIGVCEFADCGCDGPEAPERRHEAWVTMVQLGQEMEATHNITSLKPKDVLHLCDRCHGEVYTFPQMVIGLTQRLSHPAHRFADFVYADREGDELVITDAVDDTESPEIPGINIHTTPDGVFIPLDVLEAVVAAMRDAGLRSLEGDEA